MFVSLFCFSRCTILETGPVQSQIHQTSEDLGKAIDHDTADEKTKKLKEIWGENFQNLCSKKMETTEMAAFVKGIILGQNTNFVVIHTPIFLLIKLPPSSKILPLMNRLK